MSRFILLLAVCIFGLIGCDSDSDYNPPRLSVEADPDTLIIPHGETRNATVSAELQDDNGPILAYVYLFLDGSLMSNPLTDSLGKVTEVWQFTGNEERSHRIDARALPGSDGNWIAKDSTYVLVHS